MNDFPVRKAPAGVANGALQIAYGTHIFAGGGTSAHDVRIAPLRPEATVALAPATAAKLGFSAGVLVDVFCGERALRNLTVRIDPMISEQTIGLIDGLPEAPASTIFGSEAVRLEAVRVVEPALA